MYKYYHATTDQPQQQFSVKRFTVSIDRVSLSSLLLFIIMPKARRSSYSMAFKIKVIAEAEAVENNSEIAREYGLSESMVRRWRRDQATILSGELKMSAKRATMGRFTPKYPELDQQVMEWFSQQREQGWYLLFLSEILRVFEELNDIVFQCVGNRDFDWSEICCCHDNFITCHEKSAAVTNLRLSRSKIRLLFSFP